MISAVSMTELCLNNALNLRRRSVINKRNNKSYDHDFFDLSF